MLAATATALVFFCASATAQSSLRAATYAAHDSYVTSLRTMDGKDVRIVFASNGTSTTDPTGSAETGPTTFRTCNTTKLAEMLRGTVFTDANCKSFAQFGDPAFGQLNASEQAERLEAFCGGKCKSFDKTVAEWREWCASEEATFTISRRAYAKAMKEEENAVEQPFNWFTMLACSKDSNGTYCFDTISAGFKAENCSFTSTCCFAEMKKVMPDMVTALGGDCGNSTQSCSA